ncbi:MAG: banIM [Evtepia sp.]|nr:banIM [Evtepia sp.]
MPAQLKKALEIQAGIVGEEGQITENLFAEIKSYHINQRNEGIDLNGISGALMATQNMQMQTFIAKPLICLNDQGGERMDVTEEITSTLRAKMGGHLPIIMEDWTRNTDYYSEPYTNESDTGDTQPLLFDNHAKDCRYDGPLNIAPTVAAIYGTGGNNVPLVSKHLGEESYCIASNIINRQDANGGNGCGFQENISYTLTTADIHAVFSLPKTYQNVVGALCVGDEKGIGNQYVTQDKCIIDYPKIMADISSEANANAPPEDEGENQVKTVNLVRRLTPLECERLQGFPGGWTDIPKASDSPRYKALGNSVAIPCVDFIMRGIAYFLRKINR